MPAPSQVAEVTTATILARQGIGRLAVLDEILLQPSYSHLARIICRIIQGQQTGSDWGETMLALHTSQAEAKLFPRLVEPRKVCPASAKSRRPVLTFLSLTPLQPLRR